MIRVHVGSVCVWGICVLSIDVSVCFCPSNHFPKYDTPPRNSGLVENLDIFGTIQLGVSFCEWKKSCTGDRWFVPLFYSGSTCFNHPVGGAGFLPSWQNQP